MAAVTSAFLLVVCFLPSCTVYAAENSNRTLTTTTIVVSTLSAQPSLSNHTRMTTTLVTSSTLSVTLPASTKANSTNPNSLYARLSTAVPISSSTVAHLLQLQRANAMLRQAAVVARIRQKYTAAMRVFYQTGNSEADLPECEAFQVCNKVDTYATPWVERQCRCPGRQICSKSIDAYDGRTIVDKSRMYKTCEPVQEILPTCRFFRDITWTFTQKPDNSSSQKLNCICPKNSNAYIIKHEAIEGPAGTTTKYSFACSPQARQQCRVQEPCRLFTVKKRRSVDEVNTNTLCDCPQNQRCPSHHSDASISPGSVFRDDHVKIFSAYCTAN